MRQPSDGGCVCCENESSAFVSVRPATAKPVDCKKSRRFTNYPQEVWRLVQDAAQRGHPARMMPQVLERIHQKTATTLSTVRTAHNQFAKGIVPVQRPSSMRSESGYYRVPVLSRSRLLGHHARCWISCDKGRYRALFASRCETSVRHLDEKSASRTCAVTECWLRPISAKPVSGRQLSQLPNSSTSGIDAVAHLTSRKPTTCNGAAQDHLSEGA